jgi:hypothetical protein
MENYHSFGGDSEKDWLYLTVIVLGLFLLVSLYMNTPDDQNVFMLVIDNYDPIDSKVKRKANFYCIAFWGLLLGVAGWSMCPSVSHGVQKAVQLK